MEEPQDEAIKIYFDSKLAITTKKLIFHSIIKYINIKYHFIKKPKQIEKLSSSIWKNNLQIFLRKHYHEKCFELLRNKIGAIKIDTN